MKYLIHDLEDGTFHVGGGEWSHDRERAVQYDSVKKAREGVNYVDEAQILRHRLRIVDHPIDEENHGQGSL